MARGIKRLAASSSSQVDVNQFTHTISFTGVRGSGGRESHGRGGAIQVHGFGGDVGVFQAGAGVEDYYAVCGI